MTAPGVAAQAAIQSGLTRAWSGGLLALFMLIPLLSACSSQNASDRIATESLHLSLTAMRFNEHLMVQATLYQEGDRQQRVHLNGKDRIEVSLNGETHLLEEQWNGVYSNQIPYQEGVLVVDLVRSGNQASARETRLNLPVSPEFQSPRSNAIFQTQSDDHIPLRWTGIATENGEYELRCTSREDGNTHYRGSFAATDRQGVDIPVDQLLKNLTDLNRRGFCEAQFTLRGVSTVGTVAPELADGDLIFESNVSRKAIIRHNALF